MTDPFQPLASEILAGAGPVSRRIKNMSTRGAIGFRLNGVDHITYNHSDSYPSWLGKNILGFLAARKTREPKAAGTAFWKDQLRAEVAKLIPVGDKKPTKAQIKKLAKFANLTVGEREKVDWYCLLRNAQGDLEKMLEAGYYKDSHGFLSDSLFCE